MKSRDDRKKQCRYLQAKPTSAPIAPGTTPQKSDFSDTRKHDPEPEEKLPDDLRIRKSSQKIKMYLTTSKYDYTLMATVYWVY